MDFQLQFIKDIQEQCIKFLNQLFLFTDNIFQKGDFPKYGYHLLFFLIRLVYFTLVSESSVKYPEVPSLVPESVFSCFENISRRYFFQQILTNLFFLKNKFIYLFIFGCVASSFLCEGFLQSWRAGATLHRSARASYCRGLSHCGAQAPDAQAQQLWLTGLVAPRHV